MAPSNRRRVFIVGGYVTPFIGRRHPAFVDKETPGGPRNPTLEEHIASAVKGCLDSVGCASEAIDRAWVGNGFGELFSNQGHLGAAVAQAAPGLLYKPSARLEGACASGGLAFSTACDSLQAGDDVVLVVGAEVQANTSARQGGDYLARASHYQRQRGLDDFTFPAIFAKRMKAYREKYNLSDQDVDLVAIKAFQNASRNPLAHMHKVKLSAEQAAKSSRFLKNQELAPWLKNSDCSQVSDGGAALLLASEEGLRRLGVDVNSCVEVLAVAQATGDLLADGDPLRLTCVATAAERAYAAAHITPAQIQVAEVHDCFSVAELLMYEALGFCKQGEAIELVRRGHTALDGALPVNTGGGLLAYGHPVGATGVKQLVEIFKQMKGRCDSYQMSRRPALGLAANMGGDDKTAVVTLLKDASAQAKL